ncbi:acyltransferase family protein [Aquicoccus sp.]|uniref:acyltransferase family protein n=1 Tax=Aquicoccus sp. TaxID=2055851 RepID=UPI00356318BD
MKYRAEIDGLRTVAVVPVILFHAGFSVFSGGFVGVDVFFVISGYLITTLLLQDLERGRFSLLDFYERRIRRILPALCLVVALCFPAAWVLMLPDQYRDFSQSVAAVALFVSNVLFWLESGYFAGAAELKPLLHTWSLAVEEQYYVFFPVLLAFLWRFGRRTTVIVLVVLTLASLLSTEWAWRFARTANFYLIPFRIWELLAGSLCAIAMRHREIPGHALLGGLGLAMICAAIVLFDEATPFPSFYALLPVGGSCLVILFARRGTLPATLLSTAPFVGIGLISYSAYLWHQPLFAFARLASPYAPSSYMMLLLSAVSLGLAFLTWRFVEQPFRKRGAPFLSKRRNIFAMAGIAGIALMFAGGIGHLRDGFPQRFDPGLDAVLAIPDEWWRKRAACHVEDAPKPHPIEACITRSEHSDIDVALIGDSHSLAISEVVQADLRARGLTSYAVSYTGCIGLPGFYRVDVDASHQCARHNRETLSFIRDNDIGTVVLTSRFPLYLYGNRFDNGDGGQEPGDPVWIDLVTERDTPAGRTDPARRARVLAAYRSSLLALLEEVNVVLVYPIPEAGWDVVRYAVHETIGGQAGRLEISTGIAAYRDRNAEIVDLFDDLDHPNLRKVDPGRILCGTIVPDRCVNAVGDTVLYRDEDHLSYAGAAFLAPPIGKAVEDLARPEATLPATRPVTGQRNR